MECPLSGVETFGQLVLALLEYNRKLPDGEKYSASCDETFSGPDHKRKFTACVSISNESGVVVAAHGSSLRKSEALNAAAVKARDMFLERERQLASSPKPLQPVQEELKELGTVKHKLHEGREAHLGLLRTTMPEFAGVFDPMIAQKVDYDTVVGVAVVLLKSVKREAEAEMHNRLMHALNGNGLRADLHAAIDQALDRSRGVDALERKSNVMSAVASAFGRGPASRQPVKPQKTNRPNKPRTGANKKRNQAQHAKNGNEAPSCEACNHENKALLSLLAELDEAMVDYMVVDERGTNFSEPHVHDVTVYAESVRVRAEEQAGHNAEMHAMNGNEMVQMVADQPKGRGRPEYQEALERFNVEKRKDGLSKIGNDALLQMLDPCADIDRNVVDVPTGLVDHILTTRVVSEFTISKPSNMNGNTTWECMITTDQFSGGMGNMPAGFLDGSAQVPSIYGSAAGAFVYSADPTAAAVRSSFIGEPIVVHRKAAPATEFFPNNFVGGTMGDLAGVPIPQMYTANPYRVTAIGFEVVNTTAPLYKSGAATCFESPARKIDQVRTFEANWPAGIECRGVSNLASLGLSTASIWSSQDCRSVFTQRPPKTLAEATNAKGSRTWPASEGYYAPASFEELMDVSNPVPFIPGWYNAAQNEGIQPSYNTVQCLFPGRAIASDATSLYNWLIAYQETSGSSGTGGTFSQNFKWAGAVGNYRYVPTTRKGVIFSGLSPETTLQLRVVMYITRVPQVAQLDLYTMAFKAPGYDPYFWAAYKYCQETMPIGATFNENPLGEWFNSVTKFLSKAAPVIGSLVPGGGVLGQAIGTAATAARHWNKGKSKANGPKKFG